MERPTITGTTTPLYPKWAFNDIQEVKDLRGDGQLAVLDNKTQIPEEFQNTGLLFRQNLPYDFLNFQLNLIYQWIVYLHEGEVGDIRSVDSSITVEDMEDRFGGIWEEVDTVGGVTRYKKIPDYPPV